MAGPDCWKTALIATTTSSDGTPIHYDVSGEGDGPLVVLVHGITEDSRTWRPVVERLASHHRVVALDLRGHGSSGTADDYDLAAMAADVAAVTDDVAAEQVHLVGHSLGGAVVSVAGATHDGAGQDIASVTNVDQSLHLAGFKAQLMAVEDQLRDPDAFPSVIDGLFTELAGPLEAGEFQRVSDIRDADQDVVLGIWELLLTSSTEEIDEVIAGALTGYADRPVPYLSLFGIDPGPDYPAWLTTHIPEAEVEVWPDHGHYPHLVDPDRFVSRLERFWG